jgi:hypothetical protein
MIHHTKVPASGNSNAKYGDPESFNKSKTCQQALLIFWPVFFFLVVPRVCCHNLPEFNRLATLGSLQTQSQTWLLVEWVERAPPCHLWCFFGVCRRRLSDLGTDKPGVARDTRGHEDSTKFADNEDTFAPP